MDKGIKNWIRYLIYGLIFFSIIAFIPLDEAFFIIVFAVPIIIVLIMILLFFGSDYFKKYWKKATNVSKAFAVAIRLIAIIITAFVAFVVMMIVGFANGSFSMSTYGTPIYRPKLKT